MHLVDAAGTGGMDTDRMGTDRMGTFVNMQIIEQGLARPLTIEPNSTFAREFADAAGRASRADLGMWGACSP